MALLAVSALSVFAVLGLSPVQEASAVRKQSCDQEDSVVAACVNASVERNRICVGVLTEAPWCN